MRVCFVTGEIFHWGIYGGIGSLTRTIGSELVKRGVEVYILMPCKSPEQRSIETLDGMTVIGLPSRNSQFWKICDADIYHSEEATDASYLVHKKNSNAKHLITFQNPMTVAEEIKTIWALNPEWQSPFYRQIMELKLRYTHSLTKKAVTMADVLTCQAKYLGPVTTSMFHLASPPLFLPNPVAIPVNAPKKAETPTVCFLGRWDPVKRVESFVSLAKEFRGVDFIVAGAASNLQRDQQLRKNFSGIPNLQMPGVVFGEEKNRILEKSWILVNTSIRECLPVSFLEAVAYKCAILSNNNPDNFAEEFGYHAAKDDFTKGLHALLKDNNWLDKGSKGYEYVKQTHKLQTVINSHIDLYKQLTESM